MHKLLTAGVALLALGLSVPAKAADMPVKYVAPAPVLTWTGCYVVSTSATSGDKTRQIYGRAVEQRTPKPFADRLRHHWATDTVSGPVGGGQGWLQLPDRRLGLGP